MVLNPNCFEMQYTGENCAASNNSQDLDKILCEGNRRLEDKVFIRASDKENPDDKKAKVWFEGIVDLNETFNIDATNAGEDKLKSNTYAPHLRP